MKRNTIVSVLVGVALLFSVGCASTTQNQQVATFSELVIFIGTSEALRAHPEWRPGFELAATELEVIATAETVDFSTLLAIVSRIPGGDASDATTQRLRLGVVAATLFIGDIGAQPVSPENTAKLKEIAKALAGGIRLGLAN